jgi:transposase-like protein
MSKKQQYKQYIKEFKEEAVALVIEQGFDKSIKLNTVTEGVVFS